MSESARAGGPNNAKLGGELAARAKIGRDQWMALSAALLGWMFDGVEQGLFPLVARPALLELMGPDAAPRIGTWLSMITSAFLVGAALGGIVFGWLGDRVGRVRAMAWSVLVYSVFSGLCAFAQTPWQLAVFRCVASVGMGGEWALGVALVMEVWPSRSRPTMAGLIGAAANVGFVLISLVGVATAMNPDGLAGGLMHLGLPSAWIENLMGPDKSFWRLLMLVGAAPALLTFFIRLFVPESKRWEQAAETTPPVRVADIFAPQLRRNTILATCLGAIALLGTWGSVLWLPSWAAQLSPGDLLVRPKTLIAISIGATIGTIVAAYLAQWTNRRSSYFCLALSSLLVCGYLFDTPLLVCGYQIHTPMEFGPNFLTMCFFAGATTASFYGWLPLYLPELFPTRVRATGQGFAFNFGRVLAAGGTLASGQLLNFFHEDYARTGAVTSLVYLLGLVLIWFCPETKGRPLPE